MTALSHYFQEHIMLRKMLFNQCYNLLKDYPLNIRDLSIDKWNSQKRMKRAFFTFSIVLRLMQKPSSNSLDPLRMVFHVQKNTMEVSDEN